MDSKKIEHPPKVHIGKIIQEKVKRSGLTITEFAEKINLSRPAVYQLFNKQSIDCDVLGRICLVLGENLFAILYSEFEKVIEISSTKDMVKETESVYITNNNNNKEVVKKLEHIHQDLISIKNILIEMKEEKNEEK
jgi:transcriptional regulator with XRE-family HTH domain